MNSYLVSDIFGLTNALLELADKLNIAHSNVIDPYSGYDHGFESEQSAYSYFQKHVGLEKYAQHLKTQLNTVASIKHVIAFSVGASALWKISPNLSPNKVAKSTLFYSSQIRHSHALTPAIPTRIIFPKYEPHFDVHALAETLRKTVNVTVVTSDYLHGFMNPLSSHFNQTAYQHYVTQLANEI